MKIFDTLDQLAALAGQVVATSGWTTISQTQIQQFADATGDQQWIHTDPVRAKAGPFGSTIAHGFLTLSLIPKFFDECLDIKHSRMGVNYGLNKVRFIAPVPVNSSLRGQLKLLSTTPIEPAGALQMVWEVTVERQGSDKPVCVAESIVRRYP
jgi:acyl dehydratase